MAFVSRLLRLVVRLVCAAEESVASTFGWWTMVLGSLWIAWHAGDLVFGIAVDRLPVIAAALCGGLGSLAALLLVWHGYYFVAKDLTKD